MCLVGLGQSCYIYSGEYMAASLHIKVGHGVTNITPKKTFWIHVVNLSNQPVILHAHRKVGVGEPVCFEGLGVCQVRFFQGSFHEVTSSNHIFQNLFLKEGPGQLFNAALWQFQLTSSYPVILVKIKDGEIRFCIDYQKLNELTRADTYLVSQIEDLLHCLLGTIIFATLDFMSR